MKFIIAACLAAAPFATGQGGYIQEFFNARKVEATDPLAAEQGMRRSFELAIAARNADYALSAGLNACHLAYNRGAPIDAGNLAAEVIAALDPLPPAGPRNDAFRRASLIGFVERGLLVQGKTGDAWLANRAAAESLRGKKVLPTHDGLPINAAEVSTFPNDLSDLAWRIVERESEYLDLAGRSLDALAMLDDAARQLGNLESIPHARRFYPLKVLTARASLLDFLGHEEQAIAVQRKLLEIPATDRPLENALGILEFNLLRNRSQWEGPSETLLAEARNVGARLQSIGHGEGVDALLAKMESDLRESDQAMKVLLAEATEAAQAGHLMRALYADRDLLFERSRRGETDLDPEFIRLLEKARLQGNKRAEPSLYRRYAQHLMDTHRPAEACHILNEALRLTRSFRWHLHEPPILTNLVQARLAMGDRAGAEAALAEITRWLEDHPDAPAARRATASLGQIIALAQLGETEAAKTLLTEARIAAADVPDHRKRWFAPEMEALVLTPGAPAPAPVATAGPPAPLRVQPLGITTVSRPATTARTTFIVFNPSRTRVTGHWNVTGPGADHDPTQHTLTFDAAKPAVTLTIDRSIPGADEARISARITGANHITNSEIQVAWTTSGTTPSPATTWRIDWDPQAATRVVMDASGLEANPFRSVPLFHELSLPPDGSTGVLFRLTSPTPLRFEYYHPESGRLLAIDANGNGDFSDPGDLFLATASGTAAAFIPAKPGDARTAVEIRIFTIDGNAPLPGGKPHTLRAESLHNGEWTLEAENHLR